MKTVSVFGLGYIGLPTAAMFAARGVRVIGVDVNRQVVDAVNQGHIHIAEPGLEPVVQDAVFSGQLRATCHPEPADVFLVAVPTPLNAASEPDISHIVAAAKSIAPLLRKGNLVILESTSPVGTTEQLAAWLAQARPDLSFPQQKGEASDIRVAHCPERVLPGQILRELVENDRIVGGMTPLCARQAIDLYKSFVAGECVATDVRTAELCKLAENAFRDVNIAFANELSMLCGNLDIDVWELIRLANRHPRVNILQPGCGVGGHCIAVDPWFIVHANPEGAGLIRMARQVNEAKPQWVLDRVAEAVAELTQNGTEEKDLRIACFGLGFKPNVGDVSASPALRIVTALQARHAGEVVAVEPHLTALPAELSGVPLVSFEEALGRSDILVFLVPHAVFQTSPPLMPSPGRRIIDATGHCAMRKESSEASLRCVHYA